MSRLISLAVLLVIIFIAVPAFATVIYVSPEGDDTTGLSWATAKHSVQSGLDTAQSNDEVWVKAGTYVERITLKAGVSLYGGFAGTEDEGLQRNWKAYVTILDSNQGGSVVTAPSGATATTRIDGFTIRNGNAPQGSGIHCQSSSPTIANNTITRNAATDAPAGGSIYCASSASPLIISNLIIGNAGSGGSGIRCCYSSSPTIVNNTIVANAGEGIRCSDSCSSTITNNTIASNGSYGISGSSSTLVVSNNIVAFNSRGIYKYGGTLTLRNNDVYGNTAYNYSGISAGIGDISVEPEFTSKDHGNFHIRPGSLCRNAGWNGAAALPATDMDSQPRVQDGTIDIGADESDGSDPPAGPYAIIRVTTDGNDSNDGSSWESAKRTVQAGIDVASALGGEIWAASGTYNEQLRLHPHAHLYGGFAGIETTRSERDWRTNTTVIDGWGGTVVSVMCGYMCSTVDGFTMRNGNSSKGGGIHCDHSSPAIRNNTVTGNAGYGIYCFASSPTITDNAIIGSSIRGIYCNSSSPTITNNAIIGNRKGGVFCDGSEPKITDNRIIGNSTSGSGGGIWCVSSYSPTITNNTIAGNSAAVAGGGIHCDDSSSPAITNNTFVGNSAPTGGGICCGGYSSPAISNNVVAFNSSGIYKNSGSPILRNNDVYGNAGYAYSGLSAGVGDISADPLLVGKDYANFHIRPGSACIDAGWNGAPTLPAVDMDGQPRIQDGTVDIGADESDGSDPPAAPHVIVRVAPDGSDLNDGTSWASAKLTVQAGLDAASVLGGEVWVKAGTYKEQIALHPYAYVYGGFAGTEETRTQRDWTTNRSIIGSLPGCNVVNALTGHMCSRLDGFTIRGGGGSKGGGIYCSYSSPYISNNTITANTATYGAGIYCYLASPAISSNIITANKGSSNGGGGIYCDSSSPTISGNAITGNTGGGIVCSYSSPTISGNKIASNSSLSGGGIRCQYSPAAILDNTVIGNTALNSKNDGTWSFGGGISLDHSDATITNNVISRNSATTYGYGGGGIHCYGSNGTINNNKITANNAYHGGGIRCDSSSPTITDNALTGNSANGSGGGIYCSGSSSAITNNTIVGNRAAYFAGAVFCGSSPLSLSNNIVAFNSSGIRSWGTGTPTLRNNDVYANTAYDYSGLSAGAGDISIDPAFASEEYRNFHIRPGSPCVNAGWNGAAAFPATDMDGQPRIQDGTVDIGADESDGTDPPPGPYAVVRVSTDGNDLNDGSSWDLAKQTVQAGIDAASMLGGEVWVKAGVYNERISLLPYAHVYGGFAGTESARAERDWAINKSIIDGGGIGSVISAVTGYHSCSSIDGFTIRNGSATEGGGIYCRSASLTIANNTITGNTGGGIYSIDSPWLAVTGNTITGNSTTSYGGGVHCYYSRSTITDNTISANTASSGGGICCRASWPTMSNNIVSENSASSDGGGVYCQGSHSAAITNNLIVNNTSAGTGSVLRGGGGVCCLSESAAITGNTICGNTASASGGGIYYYHMSPSTVSNNILAFNSSGICSYGGGTPTLQNNDVFGNQGYDYFRLSPGVGDISAYPLFLDAAAGDYHLRLGSPCIDAGDNSAVPPDVLDLDGDGDTSELMPFDLDGNPRFVDEFLTPDIGAGTAPVVDMGAYEYQIPRRTVTIDIKPGDYPNAINLGSKGKTPVAVLTTPDFDAATVDPDSVLFVGARPVRWTIEDADRDRDNDLLLHFTAQQLDLTTDSVEATLTGTTWDGWIISGSDSVKIVKDGW